MRPMTGCMFLVFWKHPDRTHFGVGVDPANLEHSFQNPVQVVVAEGMDFDETGEFRAGAQDIFSSGFEWRLEDKESLPPWNRRSRLARCLARWITAATIQYARGTIWSIEVGHAI